MSRNRASMIIESYKHYEIEPFESSHYKWRAHIWRLDGENIRTLDPENEMRVFTTGGIESLSPDDAIEMAKRIIDGHEIDLNRLAQGEAPLLTASAAVCAPSI